MFPQIVATKLLIPPPAKYLIKRARLLDRLNESLRPGCRLVLISAPPGYGKTTLVSEWAAEMMNTDQRTVIIWISLDERDNDPGRFWSYLITGLENKTSLFRGEVGYVATFDHPEKWESGLTTLINALTQLVETVVFILDDFHVIENQAIYHALTFLLDCLPPNAHFLVLTRSDPHLPLALYKSRGQSLDLRLADLKFTLEELAKFLKLCTGLDFPSGCLEKFYVKTEGWAAGAQMAVVSLPEIYASRNEREIEEILDAISGSNRYILDYLVEEVIRKQPEEVQSFLLRTSILDEFCAPLCQAILKDKPEEPEEISAGRHTARYFLDYLERKNLFIIPMDIERCWYRYHPLFGDLLRKR